MRNSELARVLRAANPWWSRRRRASWVLDDPELATRARHEWAPATEAARSILAAVAERPRPGTITLVVGMRAVGKTTAVKDVVAHLVADPATDPRTVVLVPAETTGGDGARTVLAPDLLRTAVRTPTRTGAPACDGPRVLVVDEVGAVAGWPDVLAEACRRGDQVVATTSVLPPAALAALLAAAPSGSVTVHRLHPCDLFELLVTRPASRSGDVRAAYLRHGGLPRAVAEHRDLGDVGDDLVQRLATGLHHDVYGDEPHPLDELLAAVCATADRFVAPDPLARRLGVSTHEVGLLLDRMEHAHVLDRRRGLVDPLLHRLPYLRAPTRYPTPTVQHIAAFSR